jgi:hypothetical protein
MPWLVGGKSNACGKRLIWGYIHFGAVSSEAAFLFGEMSGFSSSAMAGPRNRDLLDIRGRFPNRPYGRDTGGMNTGLGTIYRAPTRYWQNHPSTADSAIRCKPIVSRPQGS